MAEEDAVQQCLEQLLSKESLSSDAFIKQHVDAQLSISLSVLTGHPAVAKLGDMASLDVLLKAAEASSEIILDRENLCIRPVVKQRRNTIILRDLPQDVAPHELQELFSASSEYDNLISVKPDVNHTAFVSFRNDEAAQTAALWLRTQKLRGETVKCAMKTEHGARSYFAAPTAEQGEGSTEVPPWAQGGKGQAMGWPTTACGWGGAWGQDVSDVPDSSYLDVAESSLAVDLAAGAEPDYGDVEVGYMHEFRSYSSQKLMDIRDAMSSFSKPETFVKFEKDDKQTGLFRQEPLQDWALPPEPMMPIVSNMLEHQGRKSTSTAAGQPGEEAAEEPGGKGKKRRDRKANSAGSKGGDEGAKGGTGDKGKGKGKDGADDATQWPGEAGEANDWNSWAWGEAAWGAASWWAPASQASGWDAWYGGAWPAKSKPSKSKKTWQPKAAVQPAEESATKEVAADGDPA